MTGRGPHTAHILFLVQTAFSRRDWQRYGIAELLRRGCRVSIVDAGDLLFPGIERDRRHYHEFSGAAFHVLAEPFDVQHAVRLLAEADLIVNSVGSGNVNTRNLRVLRTLSRCGRPWLYCENNVVPAMGGVATTAAWSAYPRRVYDRLRRAGPLNAIFRRLPLPLLGLRPADFAVYGGRFSRAPRALVTDRTRPIWAHSDDYDLFRRAGTASVPGDTAVFIDQFLGFHPDFVADGFPQAEVSAFYPGLLSLFERLERELGLKVVIAAHPRADYRDKAGLFGNRPIITDRLVELVRDCRVALSCYSTAVALPILYRKPVIMVGTDALLSHPTIGLAIRAMSDALARRPLRLEDARTVDLTSLLAVDPDVYARYSENFIRTTEASDGTFWEIVLDALARQGVILGPLTRRGAAEFVEAPASERTLRSAPCT